MIAGVDGTSRGWVVVVCDDHLKNPKACFITRLVDLPRDLRVAAIDVPIGLPDKGARDADIHARRALGEPRRRSVFPSPIRPVLNAGSWEEACALTERADGRKVSKQTFAILPKVAEADRLLRAHSWARRTIYEVHPELSFAGWSGAPMLYGKKSHAGRVERRELIEDVFGAGEYERARELLRGRYVGSDDLADAFAAVWTAERILTGRAVKYPPERNVDSEGVAMQIWA